MALGGFVPSILLLFLYGYGKSFLEQNGLSPIVADVVLHLYAILGILLCATHIMLFIATMTYNEKLILIYLWYAVVYFVADSFAILIISFSAFLNNAIMFGMVVFILDTMYWVLLYYFVLPVVNGFRRNIHTVVIYLA